MQAFIVTCSSVISFPFVCRGVYGWYSLMAKVSMVCHFLSLTLHLWVLLEAPSKTQLLLLWKLDVHCFLETMFFSASFVWRRDKVVLVRWLDCMCTFKVSYTYIWYPKPNFLNLQFKFCPSLGAPRGKKFFLQILPPPLDLFLYTPLTRTQISASIKTNWTIVCPSCIIH